jgi:hypothetical protein
MYHLLFVILLAFSFFEFFGKNNKIIERCLFILMLLFVTFRYGQGSDYFNYIYLFDVSANSFENALQNKDFSILTQEISFTALSYIWLKILHFSPESLNALFSFVSFVLVWLFINKYSLKPITSLLFFYCVFYLIYPFSAIRQSISISIFIYYLIPLLQNRSYLKFYLLSLLLFTIHYSSIILFVIPVVNLIKNYKTSQVYIVSVIALTIGLLLHQFLFSFFTAIEVIAGKISYYTENVGLDITSLLLRIIIFVPILFTHKIFEKDSTRELFLKIYILGFMIYLVFMTSPLISSRINVYMRYLEIILLVDFLVYFFFKKWNRILSYSFIIAIMTILYIKNINSFIDQGPYYSDVNLVNYPYVSIFNKHTIIETRSIPSYYQQYVLYD